jgi:hypothetical protein
MMKPARDAGIGGACRRNCTPAKQARGDRGSDAKLHAMSFPVAAKKQARDAGLFISKT